MPPKPHPDATPAPRRGSGLRLDRYAPALAAAGLAAGAGGVAWGLLGPGGTIDAEAGTLAVASLAVGSAVLFCVGGWLLHRGGPARLVGRAVADFADGATPPALLRITRTDAFPAADWNRMLDAVASGHRAADEPAAGPAAEPDALGPALEALPHGLLLLGHDGRVGRTNGAASRLLRTPREKLTGAGLDALLGDGELAGRAAAVAAGLERRGASMELAAGVEGESVLRATLRPLRGGPGGGEGRTASAGALLLLEDVTQQRAADRARDLFVAQASHELRAPLTNIQLHAERAIDLGTTPGAEAAGERAECLNHVNEEVLRLSRMIDEVLSVSQIKAGSLSAAQDDVAWATLLERVVGDHGPAARKREQTLELDAEPGLPVLQGDREKLSMLVHNLVGNAVKYGRRGGRTVVRATCDEQHLEVRVLDDGPGVAPAEREKVFEPFFRGTHDPGEGEKRPEGTGLGLPLAAEVAQLHRGTLAVEDGEGGRGACFVLRLPLRAGSAAERADGGVAGKVGSDAGAEASTRRAA